MAGDALPGHSRSVDVVVIGSANLDVIARVPRSPQPGETLIASDYSEHPGGKGLNQAVSAARQAATAFVGHVGDDEAGRRVMSFARSRGVDVRDVATSAVPTGRALITLHPDGENVIVVAPLANAELAVDHVDSALADIRASIALLQFEIPAEVVDAVATWARDSATRLVVNPSPMRPIAAELLAQADPLIVNVLEAAEILREPATTEELARKLSEKCGSVVVTAGPDGAVLGVGGETTAVVAPTVVVSDSSGAGDAFAGTLCARLARNESLEEAVRAAVQVGAETVATARDER